MNARRPGIVATVAVMAASGSYVFVYLYRWEWNRALISAAIFIAAEVALVGAIFIACVTRLDRRLDGFVRGQGVIDERVRRRLQENVPEPAKPFAWLNRPQQTNVFVPVLFGAGIVLSGLAWLVDRVARATAGPAVEHGLARRLTALQPPPGGLLGGRPHQPYEPRRSEQLR